jgi:hypothetical protein
MRSRELLIAAALLASAGCLHNPDPRPRSMAEIQSDTHGGYAVVRAGGQVVVWGELIAIGPSDVWILSGGRVIHTPLERVAELEVHPYALTVSAVAAWGLLGTLSTISHGFFLVLSAPVWIVTSTITAAVHSRTAHEKYHRDQGNWPELAKWARFPQGIPPGVTEAEILYGRSLPGGLGPPSTVEPFGPPTLPPAPSPPPAPPAQPPAGG